jgi:protein TonB
MPVEANVVPPTEIHDRAEQILRARPRAIRQPRSVPVRPCQRELFAETLLEASSSRHAKRTAKLSFSIGLHILVLLVLVLPPLYFTDSLDLKQFTQTFLVAPPPPPPPPPPVVKTNRAPRRVFLSGGKLIAPTAVPSRVVILKEEPLPPEMGTGIAGGVPGGVPGGQLGGVIGGIISDVSRAKPPVPVLSVQRRAPVRVGGRVRPPRVLSKTSPIYPPLAKQTRVEGVVSIDAVIDTDGNVSEMSVVSGHPLLISAALDAVKKWKYEPTYLNDQAVAVQLIVTVTFQLGQYP